MPFNSIN